MLNNDNDSYKKLSDLLRSDINTDIVIGKQFQLGEFLCVPVMALMVGTGSMTGEGNMDTKEIFKGNGKGEGNGAGLGLIPTGFLVTKGNEIQYIGTPIAKGLFESFGKIPVIIDKLANKKVRSNKS